MKKKLDKTSKVLLILNVIAIPFNIFSGQYWIIAINILAIFLLSKNIE